MLKIKEVYNCHRGKT